MSELLEAVRIGVVPSGIDCRRAYDPATGWEGRVAKYISDNIGAGTSLEDFVYATQFIQAEAITSAYSSWRRQFTGGVTGARCAGALVWQLNDVVGQISTDHGFAAAASDEACPRSGLA